MRLLVTGGAGFIGSNFVKHIFRTHPDYRICVMDALTYAGNLDNFPAEVKESGRFEFWQANINQSEIVGELVSRSDVIVHFAAETHVARSIYGNRHFFETDVLGTQCLANAISKSDHIQMFVHISTSETYGTAETAPMTEDHPLKPMSPYASAKAGADRLVYSYYATYDMPAVIIRPFNNYGPNQHLEKVVPRFITSALLDEPLTIHGDGSALRDWLFVEDHCSALDKLIHTDPAKVKGEVINIGSGRDISVLDIAKMVVEIMDKPKELLSFTEDRLGQVHRHISSTDKAERLLGWKASTPFEAGLRRTIEWYKDNPLWWEKLKWMRSVAIAVKDGKIIYS